MVSCYIELHHCRMHREFVWHFCSLPTGRRVVLYVGRLDDSISHVPFSMSLSLSSLFHLPISFAVALSNGIVFFCYCNQVQHHNQQSAKKRSKKNSFSLLLIVADNSFVVEMEKETINVNNNSRFMKNEKRREREREKTTHSGANGAMLPTQCAAKLQRLVVLTWRKSLYTWQFDWWRRLRKHYKCHTWYSRWQRLWLIWNIDISHQRFVAVAAVINFLCVQESKTSSHTHTHTRTHASEFARDWHSICDWSIQTRQRQVWIDTKSAVRHLIIINKNYESSPLHKSRQSILARIRSHKCIRRKQIKSLHFACQQTQRQRKQLILLYFV